MGTLFFLLLVVAGFLAYKYNDLQRRAQGVREGHSNLVASMKKRLDLANRLIDIAKGYADHEKLTHIAIAEKENPAAVLAATGQVNGALAHVTRLATEYPELKASEPYQMAMGQLTALEEGIQEKREGYNARVRDYNTELTQLPTVLFAGSLGFHQAPYFNVDDADSLEALKDFRTDDGEHVKALLASASRKVVDTSTMLGTKAVEHGTKAYEKGREMAEKRKNAQAPETGPLSKIRTDLSGVETVDAASYDTLMANTTPVQVFGADAAEDAADEPESRA